MTSKASRKAQAVFESAMGKVTGQACVIPVTFVPVISKVTGERTGKGIATFDEADDSVRAIAFDVDGEPCKVFQPPYMLDFPADCDTVSAEYVVGLRNLTPVKSAKRGKASKASKASGAPDTVELVAALVAAGLSPAQIAKALAG